MKRKMTVALTPEAYTALTQKLAKGWGMNTNAALEMMVRAHAGLPPYPGEPRLLRAGVPRYFDLIAEGPDAGDLAEITPEERDRRRVDAAYGVVVVDDEPVAEDPVVPPPAAAPEPLSAPEAEPAAPVEPAGFIRQYNDPAAPEWVRALGDRFADGEDLAPEEENALRRWMRGEEIQL